MKSFIKHITFVKREISIPADYRPMYKIGHLVLILNMACWSNKATLMKLHFLSWAIKSTKNMGLVKSWIENEFKSDYHIWGMEPTVNRAVTFMVAEGIAEQIGGEYCITEKGVELFKKMKKDKELFVPEKNFLSQIGKTTVSEKIIKQLVSKFF